jgi:ureidoglycolate dehydrogenase (NAD+)
MRGMGSHGVMRVPRYVAWIRSGELNPRPKITAQAETAASVLLDADSAAGPVAMVYATRAAMAKAKDTGVGVALVRTTTHTAALGYYTQLAAREDFAAIAVAASGPNMAYHGARAAGVSTAPLSIAVPSEHAPLALDMGSGIVSIGKLMQARRRGEPIEARLALDAQGEPTTDAKRAAIPLPLGGAKGSGLALMIECLTSLLCRAPILSPALENIDRKHRQNGMVIAIDIAQFGDPRDFRKEAARLARDLKALPAEPGVEILMPGERGHRNAEAAREHIDLPPTVLAELKETAKSFGIAA